MNKEDLLLAHIQGRLDVKEAEQFQALVESDADFAAEVAAMTTTRAVLANEETAEEPDGWKRLSSAIDAETLKPANQNIPKRLSWLQTACVAAVAVACWHFAATPLLTSQEAPITMASPTAEGPTLQVVFTDNAAISQVSEVLYALEGTVVNGPSAIGIYRVEFADQAARDAALKVLAQRSDLVGEILSE